LLVQTVWKGFVSGAHVAAAPMLSAVLLVVAGASNAHDVVRDEERADGGVCNFGL